MSHPLPAPECRVECYCKSLDANVYIEARPALYREAWLPYMVCPVEERFKLVTDEMLSRADAFLVACLTAALRDAVELYSRPENHEANDSAAEGT